MRTENKLLREKVDALIQRIFGAQSERLDAAQLLLMLQGLDHRPKAEEPVEVEAPRRSTDPSPPRERGPRVPDHLPVVEEVIVPEPVKACPEAWRHIGEEVTEQLDYEPARFFKRRIVRQKFARKDHPFAAPIIAPLHTLQDRCIAAPGLIAAVIVAKYCDHLPLYRQEQIFATRHAVDIPRQTLAQWMGLAADWLRPIYEHIRTGVLGGGYVQIDETPIEYLCPGHGETKLGWLWTCARPGGDTVFAWHVSRAAACLQSIIPSAFRGTVQSDGYSAYPAFVRAHNTAAGAEAITLAACWAHARRAIFEARNNAPRTAAWLLRQIAHLYRIERELRVKKAGPNLRQAVRAAQSAPILRRLHAALRLIRPRCLPKSAMGRAIAYVLDQWPGLEAHLRDGRIEIDNNGVENAIRPTALGKKNWLFIGAAHTGQRGAILYTIVESCRRRGIDPQAYLRHVLTRLPAMTTAQIPDITPEAYAKSLRRPEHLQLAS
ncbi:MAG: IS66 family transposase [Rhodobacteraceae bacterium]|nr:IS66 family transposase [Paracoccaceae bacterium]